MIAPACAGMRWAPAGLLTATAVSVLAVTDGAVGTGSAVAATAVAATLALARHHRRVCGDRCLHPLPVDGPTLHARQLGARLHTTARLVHLLGYRLLGAALITAFFTLTGALPIGYPIVLAYLALLALAAGIWTHRHHARTWCPRCGDGR